MTEQQMMDLTEIHREALSNLAEPIVHNWPAARRFCHESMIGSVPVESQLTPDGTISKLTFTNNTTAGTQVLVLVYEEHRILWALHLSHMNEHYIKMTGLCTAPISVDSVLCDDMAGQRVWPIASDKLNVQMDTLSRCGCYGKKAMRRIKRSVSVCKILHACDHKSSSIHGIRIGGNAKYALRCDTYGSGTTTLSAVKNNQQ